MKKKQQEKSVQKEEKASTLRDLLDATTLAKLTSTEKELRQAELKKKEEEQKQREKNKSFAELLNDSKLDWRQYK